jgi:hypothetical protein
MVEEAAKVSGDSKYTKKERKKEKREKKQKE